MSRKQTPIDPKIKCPKCGAIFPDVRSNGSYKRDSFEIPQYLCKVCKKSFSASVIKIKINKPPENIEIGHSVKVEIEIFSTHDIKEVKFELSMEGNVLFLKDLIRNGNSHYSGVWDAQNSDEGKCLLKFIVADDQNYKSIHSKSIWIEQHYDLLISIIAKQMDLEWSLLKGLIWKESSFQKNVVSNKGAIGLTQLMPATAKEQGVLDAYDPEQNITGGAKYLKKLMNLYNGDISLALGAYNWGPGNVAKSGCAVNKFPKSVKDYIRRILAFKEVCENFRMNYYEE